MANELVLASDVNVDELKRIGTMLALSGYFDTAPNRDVAVAQMCVKVMAGRELGFGPFASVNGIHVIKGKPGVSANLMASAVKSNPRYDYRMRQYDSEAVKIEFFEIVDGKRESLGISEFTRQDAKVAGTQNMDRFGRNMMFARAMSNGVKWFCPDVFNGNAVYVPEELGADVDGDGNVIDVDYRQVDKATGEVLSTTPPAPEPTTTEIKGNGVTPTGTASTQKATESEPTPRANGNGKPEKESTPHTRFHGQGASTFGPNWDDVRPLLAKHVAGSDTSNDITDANKDALYENFKMNSRAWQKWAREGMDEAQLIVLLPESVEIQIAGNPFEEVAELSA